MPKFTNDVPEEFYKTREEIEDEVYQDFKNGNIDYDDLVEEFEMINDMYDGETQ